VRFGAAVTPPYHMPESVTFNIFPAPDTVWIEGTSAGVALVRRGRNIGGSQVRADADPERDLPKPGPFVSGVFVPAHKIRIGDFESEPKWCVRVPTDGIELRDIEQLARSAVRPRGVEDKVSTIAHDFSN
jgi:hypothetical protein